MSRNTRTDGTLAVARRFVQDVRPFAGALSIVILLQLVAVGLELLRPWPLKWVFDDALIGGGEGARAVVGWAALALTGIVLVRVVLEHVAGLKLIGTGHAVTRALRLRIFRQLVELPPTYHARQKAGDLLMRLMGDAPMVSTMMVEASAHLLVRAVQVVASLAVMLWVDASLTLTLLLFLPLVLIVSRLLASRLTIATRKQRRKEGELADTMQESIGAAAVLQSLGREQDAVRSFARSNRRTARAGLKTARAAARLSSSVEALMAVAVALTVFLGGLRVLDPASTLSPGQLLVFLSLVRGILKPVRAAAKHQARVAKGVACGARISRVLDEQQLIRPTSGTRRPPARPRRLSFEGASFAYPDGAEALQGVDLELRAGELVALVGPSGAGKSTLCALALRLMDPTEGRVTLDDVPLQEFDLDGLRERYALSMQDTVLFGATVRDNLLLGRLEAEDEELWGALEQAAAADFVRALPGGLDAELGADGGTLSGGQRKRLCLARALLREAPILILDEPFQGLDAESAARVKESLLAHVRGGGMALLITHEPGRLDGVDRVQELEPTTTREEAVS